MQYVPKTSKETADTDKDILVKVATNKGKGIAHDDPNLGNKSIHEAGPSFYKLNSMEIVTNPTTFIGINNVPLNDPKALASINPLFGFASNNHDSVDMQNVVMNTPIGGVVQNVENVLHQSNSISCSDTFEADFIGVSTPSFVGHNSSPNQIVHSPNILRGTFVVESPQDIVQQQGNSFVPPKGHSKIVSRVNVTPDSDIRNQTIASDLQIASPFWGQEKEVQIYDNLQPTPIATADPSKYLLVNSHQGDHSDFTPVMSKSKKKRLRQKAAKAA